MSVWDYHLPEDDTTSVKNRREDVTPPGQKIIQGDGMSSWVDVSQGALTIDPDVVLRGRGMDVPIRHLYNNQQTRVTALGAKWDMSIFGELFTIYHRTIRQRNNDQPVIWDYDGNNYYRYAGNYNTLEIPEANMWLERTPDGTEYLYKKYVSLPTEDSYGHLVSIRDMNQNETYYTYDDGDNASHRLQSITEPAGRSVYFAYSTPGYLESLTDWAGRTTYYEHDASGNLTKLTGPEGCVTQYEYDASHNMTALTDAEGYTTYYQWPAYENIKKITQMIAPDGGVTYYNYNYDNVTMAAASTVIDAENGVTYYTVSGHGMLTSKKILGIGQEEYTVNAHNEHTADTDVLGNTTYYDVDVFGNRTSYIDAVDNVTYYSYRTGNKTTGNQAGNRRTKISAPLGAVVYYNWDERGNLIEQIDPLKRSTQTQYDIYGQVIATTDALNKTSYFGYDAYGNRTWVQDPLANASYFTYDLAGNVIASTNALGATSYYEYDKRDRLTRLTNALGQVSQFAYDGLGRRTITLSPGGEATYYEYDFRGNVTRMVDPLFQSWEREYDKLGNVIASSNPLNDTTYYYYDQGHRLQAVRNPNGVLTYYQYNANGNPIALVDAKGNATYFNYDVLNRQTQIIDALGNSWQTWYDALSRRYCTADPLAHKTYFQYDAASQLVAAVSPLRHATYYQYDAAGRISALTNALGETVYYHYDATGKRSLQLDPVGHPTYYQYDALGRPTKEIDALGHEQVYHYNTLNQVIQVDKASGMGAYFAYDTDGRLSLEQRYPTGDALYFQYDARGAQTDFQRLNTDPAWMSQPDTQTWDYDAAGRLVINTQIGNDPLFGQAIHHLYYSYDAAGNRDVMSLTGPYGQNGQLTLNRTTNYSHDERGQLQIVADPFARATYYEYDALGRVAAKRVRDDVLAYYSYDAAGRVLSIENLHVSGNDPWRQYYTYDADGRRIKHVHDASSGEQYATYFAYDNANRLLQEHWLDKTGATGPFMMDYSYDAAGNRTRVTSSGATIYYEYNALNQLTLAQYPSNATYYTYQEDGALAQRKGYWDGKGSNYNTYFDWDTDESLRHAHCVPPAGGEAPWHIYYAYDSAGHRTRKTIVPEGGTVQSYDLTHDGDKVAFLHDLANNDAWFGNAGPGVYDELLFRRGMISGSSARGITYAYDALGTFANPSFRKDAFGNGGQFSNFSDYGPFSYIGAFGYEEDRIDLDLYYLWHRYYDPRHGRFISKDPVNSANLYPYVDNFPTGAVDPTGEQYQNNNLIHIKSMGNDRIASGEWGPVEQHLDVALWTAWLGLTEHCLPACLIFDEWAKQCSSGCEHFNPYGPPNPGHAGWVSVCQFTLSFLKTTCETVCWMTYWEIIGMIYADYWLQRWYYYGNKR